MSKFYKAAISNIVDGKDIGTSLLVQDFNTLNAAIKEAETHKVGEMAVIEVREYNVVPDETIIVAWNNPNIDSGETVYRDVEPILQALRDEFERFCEEDGDWEQTMSYMIDSIKDKTFPEWEHLHDAVELLHDDEINDLLSEYGDLEYMKCEDGKITEQDEVER